MSVDTETQTPIRIYRGVPVYVTQKGDPRFYASAGGLRHYAGSFASLRKHLDKALVFKQFDALHITRHGLEQVHIIGADMDRGEWSGVDADGNAVGNLKFYYELFSPVHRPTLERILRERAEFTAAEEKISAGRAAQNEVMKSLRVQRPDEGYE